MDKRFWAVIGVIVVVFAGIMFVSSHNKKGTSSSSNATPTSNVTGKLDSKVTLQEYGDFECPACESFFLVTQAVQQQYADKIKFQFSNLPLTSIHPNAFAGARAGQAAALQGKFWEMHDALYTNSNWSQWSTSSNANPYFWQYVKDIGLDVAKFKTDFASSSVNSSINADINAFNKTGQSMSTPTFFINGVYVKNTTLLDATGQPSAEAFAKVIDAAIAKNK